MRRSIALAVGAALLALTALAPGVALAATTLVVDDDGFATAASCDDATATPYTTIQSAVDAAAPGDTIMVCPGTYLESVTVSTDRLTLLGSNAGENAKSCPVRSGLASVVDGATNGFNLEADRVVLDGFTIHSTNSYGVYTAPDHSGYVIRNNEIDNNAGGIYLNSDGRINSFVQRNCIRDNNATFGDTIPFPTAGTGIYTDQGLRNVVIGNNGFRNHLNVAINLVTDLDVDGPGGISLTETSNVRVWNNKSWNDRTFLSLFNAHKIYVSGNKVRQNVDGQDWNGTAIYVGGGSDIGGEGSSAVTITGNSIVSSQLPNGFYAAIAVRGSADGVVVRRNSIRGTYNGISITSDAAGAAYVRVNRVRDVHNNGIEALVTDPYVGGGPSHQNVFSGNRVSGSAAFDCFDNTTGDEDYGVANTWYHPWAINLGNTSSPAGLCTPW